jgi:hypothetical protein
MDVVATTLIIVFLFFLAWVHERQGALEREVNRLRLLVIRIQDGMDVNDPDDGNSPESRRGLVNFFLGVMLCLTAGATVVYCRYGPERKDLWEFVSYVLPSIAALIGGFGLFYKGKRWAEGFFWISGALLGFGLVAFVASKSDGAVVGVFTGSLLLFLFCFTLEVIAINRRKQLLPETKEQWLAFCITVLLFFVAFSVMVLAYCYGEMEKDPNFWSSSPQLAALMRSLARQR